MSTYEIELKAGDVLTVTVAGSSVPPPPPPLEYGNLMGVIREHDIYDPSKNIVGATVTLNDGQSATTGSDARYYFAKVAVGDITITASATGYISNSIVRQIVKTQDNWGSIALEKDPSPPPPPPSGFGRGISPFYLFNTSASRLARQVPQVISQLASIGAQTTIIDILDHHTWKTSTGEWVGPDTYYPYKSLTNPDAGFNSYFTTALRNLVVQLNAIGVIPVIEVINFYSTTRNNPPMDVLVSHYGSFAGCYDSVHSRHRSFFEYIRNTLSGLKYAVAPGRESWRISDAYRIQFAQWWKSNAPGILVGDQTTRKKLLWPQVSTAEWNAHLSYVDFGIQQAEMKNGAVVEIEDLILGKPNLWSEVSYDGVTAPRAPTNSIKQGIASAESRGMCFVEGWWWNDENHIFGQNIVPAFGAFPPVPPIPPGPTPPPGEDGLIFIRQEAGHDIVDVSAILKGPLNYNGSQSDNISPQVLSNPTLNDIVFVREGKPDECANKNATCTWIRAASVHGAVEVDGGNSGAVFAAYLDNGIWTIAWVASFRDWQPSNEFFGVASLNGMWCPHGGETLCRECGWPNIHKWSTEWSKGKKTVVFPVSWKVGSALGYGIVL